MTMMMKQKRKQRQFLSILTLPNYTNPNARVKTLLELMNLTMNRGHLMMVDMVITSAISDNKLLT